MIKIEITDDIKNKILNILNMYDKLYMSYSFWYQFIKIYSSQLDLITEAVIIKNHNILGYLYGKPVAIDMKLSEYSIRVEKNNVISPSFCIYKTKVDKIENLFKIKAFE